jgi:hypothetical protein
LGAVFLRVINEKELELVAAIRICEFHVLDSVSLLVMGQMALEKFEACVGGFSVFNFDSIFGVVNL